MPSILGPATLPKPYIGDSHSKYYVWKTTCLSVTGKSRMPLEDKTVYYSIHNSLESVILDAVQSLQMFTSKDTYKKLYVVWINVMTAFWH